MNHAGLDIPPSRMFLMKAGEKSHRPERLRHRHQIYKGFAFTMAVLIVLLWIAYLAVNALVQRARKYLGGEIAMYESDSKWEWADQTAC